MYQLTYISAAVALPTDDQLVDLLAQAQRRNAASGVTGLLLYHDGAFIQALEGDRDAVEHTYERIKADPRHQRVRTLTLGARERRDFPDWAMGFIPAEASTDIEALKGFQEFVAREPSSPDEDSDVHLLLDRFRSLALSVGGLRAIGAYAPVWSTSMRID